MSERFYTDFAAALHGDDGRLLTHLADPAMSERFAVYRNNVMRAAIDTLAAAFPAVERLVGPEYFAHLAKAYWQKEPPRSPCLSLYGEGFADHIDGFETLAADLPYLAGVARMDRAWLEAHYAADDQSLEAGRVATLDAEILPALRPGLHASASLMRADLPVYEIWSSNRFGPGDAHIKLVLCKDLSVVWRRKGEVCHRALNAADYRFLSMLRDGASLEHASQAALDDDATFDAGAAFGAALNDGMLGAIPE